MRVTLVFTIIFLFSLTGLAVGTNVQRIGKEEVREAIDFKRSLSSEEEAYPFHRLVTLGAIRFYQRFISPVKAHSCPMYPSDSRYAYEAFRRYDPLTAFMMTADRLHRCSHDLDNYERVEVSGFIKFFDPLEPSSTIPPSLRIPSLKPLKIFSFEAKEPDKFALDLSGEDSHLFSFAQMLESEGDYKQALIEYRRLTLYFPNSPYKKQAMKSMLRCYYKSEEYLAAIHWGEELLSKGDMIEEEDEIKFLIGLSYFKVENYQSARKYFSEMMDNGKDDLREKGILLEGLSYAKERKWEESEKAFAQIKPDSKFYDNAKQSIELSKRGKNLHKKSPVIAGLLGIVPGLGYLYSGYEQTAVASFIVNGLFIYGTVEAFKQHNEGLGIMLGIISLGWYSGNIYGSVKSAQRSNIKAERDILFKFDLGFEY